MLVLALQFSKGDAQVKRTSELRRRACGLSGSGTLDQPSRRDRPCRALRGFNSLKTEEKTMITRVDLERRTDPTTLDLSTREPPVHQLGKNTRQPADADFDERSAP